MGKKYGEFITKEKERKEKLIQMIHTALKLRSNYVGTRQAMKVLTHPPHSCCLIDW